MKTKTAILRVLSMLLLGFMVLIIGCSALRIYEVSKNYDKTSDCGTRPIAGRSLIY